MNLKVKRILSLILALALVIGLSACGSDKGDKKDEGKTAAGTKQEEKSDQGKNKDAGKTEEKTSLSGAILVISREEGSGTRGAFTEITKVAEKDTDNTTPTASIQNSTDLVLTTVAGNDRTIGYISLGSLNDSVRAVPVNGVEVSEEKVIGGSYPVKRPFNIVYKEDKLNDLTKDFLAYVESKEAQAMAKDAHVIAAFKDAKDYQKKEGLSGTIRVQGSTSVDPFMQKIEEAYKALNPQVNFDHTANGSGAGIQAVIDDNADIGMASREIKKEELAKGLTDKQIAIDGIAVVVNKANPIKTLSLEQIKDIFTGQITDWSKLD